MTMHGRSISSPADALALAVRLGLGGLFLYMGLSKGLDPVGFLKLVRQYELLPQPWLLNATAALLPWLEVCCALLLLAGVAVRGNALLFLAMLIPFTAAVAGRAWAIAGTQGLPFCSVKFDCGCGAGEVYICRKLLENTLLIAGSIWLVLRNRNPLSLRFSLQKSTELPGK